MAVKFIAVLLLLGLISTALGKGGHGRRDHDKDHDHDHHDDHARCPMPYTYPQLPLTCTVTDDCTTFTCSARLESKDVTLTIKVDKSKDPLSAVITLKVPELGFDWSYSFKDGEKIQVPGFPLSIEGVEGADIWFQLNLKKFSKFGRTAIVFGLDVTAGEGLPSVTLLKGKIPVRGDGDDDDDDDDGRHHRWGGCRRFKAWWHRQPRAVKASVIISSVLVFLLLIASVVYCCKRRRSRTSGTVKVKPPSYSEATSTETKVPLEPLVNEE